MLGIHLLFLSMALVMLGTGLGLLVGVFVALDGFTTRPRMGFLHDLPAQPAQLPDRHRRPAAERRAAVSLWLFPAGA